MTKQIIMTSPTSFGVQYEINLWMKDNTGRVDQVKAVQQWSELRNTLTSIGADVLVIPQPPENCPDAVFTANAGLIYKDNFIPSRFHHDERAVEEPFFINWMMNYFKVEFQHFHGTREQISFEGAGDALFDLNQNLWMGFGFRTTLNYKYMLDLFFENTDVIVRPLQLVDSRFYHLDTCFCTLDTGEVLWFPNAFSGHSQYVIEEMFKEKLITVSEEDAVRFACNAVSVDEHIVLPEISSHLREHLISRGYQVYELNMSEFMKSGGACKCLTLQINE
jgi:N-dimethylarginine dimethylaminohydrolase